MKYLTAVAAMCCCLVFAMNPSELCAEQPRATASDLVVERENPFAIALYWENDSSFLKPNSAKDRHYTNGMAATFSHHPEWAQGFTDLGTLGETFSDTAAGYVFAHQFFTPENIHARRLIRDDRPYAGYLFGGVYLQRSNDSVFDHIQLDLGTTGPASQADHFQYGIHRFYGAEEPRGWRNQLQDEFTAQLTLRRKWRQDWRCVELFNHSLDQQFIPQVDLALGTVYRHVALGGTYRIGVNLPDDFGPGRIADLADATATTAPDTGMYGFVRLAGRAVEHNLFLDGNTHKDSHSVDEKTLVGEAQIGLSVYSRYRGWNLLAVYSQTFITEQFRGQDGYDSYGALMLSATHGF